MSAREQELKWYAQHGLYPQERIKEDRNGRLYVIGDWSWNQGKRGLLQPERIEGKIKDERRN